MKISNIAREIAVLANELDGSGYASAADSLDIILHKIAVPGRFIEEWEQPAATKQPQPAQANKPTSIKPKSPAQTPAAVPPVSQKPGQPDQYYSARMKKEDIAGMSEQQLLSWINFYDKMISSAKNSGDAAYISVLQQNRAELSLELSRKKNKSSTPTLTHQNKTSEDEYEYGGDDESTMTEFQKAHMEDYLASQEELKEKLRYLGGRSRIDNLVQQMTEVGFGEVADEIDQMIRLSPRAGGRLDRIQDLMAFFEELKNNPREKSMVKELASKYGSDALPIIADAFIESDKGISVVQDVHHDYRRFAARRYTE